MVRDVAVRAERRAARRRVRGRERELRVHPQPLRLRDDRARQGRGHPKRLNGARGTAPRRPSLHSGGCEPRHSLTAGSGCIPTREKPVAAHMTDIGCNPVDLFGECHVGAARSIGSSSQAIAWPGCACVLRAPALLREFARRQSAATRWQATQRRGRARGSRSTRVASGAAGAGHHGPGESRLRARRAGDPGEFERAVPEQRRRTSPGVFVFERAPVPTTAVSRQALSTGDVHSQPGVVTLGCNIHDNMIAYIVVTAAPFFGRTASDGTWSANDVPAGKYRVRIWHPLLNEVADEGRVAQLGEQRVERRIQAGAQAQARPAHRPAALMGLLNRKSAALAAAVLASALADTRAYAGEWELALDLRAVYSDGRESFLDNGQGKLRFDEDHQGVQLGRLRASWNQSLGDVFAAHVEASTWDDDDKNPIDLTEALPRIPPLSARGLQGPRASRRVLSTDVARESCGRLGNALHDHTLGDQQLDRRGNPHRRSRRPDRLVRHAHRPRFRAAIHRGAVRLERSGRHDARGAWLCAARPADDLVRTGRRRAARPRRGEERTVPRDRRAARLSTSARRCAISIAPF